MHADLGSSMELNSHNPYLFSVHEIMPWLKPGQIGMLLQLPVEQVCALSTGPGQRFYVTATAQRDLI